MKSKLIYGFISALLISFSASQVIAEDSTGPADADTSKPVNCSTAQADIATLEKEKKATSDKAVGGVLGFTPIGLIANVATGGDKMGEEQKLTAKEYNKKIDERIAQIKSACGDDSDAADDALPTD